MANLCIASIPVNKGVRVTKVEYGIVTITVLDHGSNPNMSDFPRFAVRRTLNEYKETFKSDVSYGDDIRKTCERALAFDGQASHCYREIITEAYHLAANYVDSSTYRNMTRR